MAIVALNTSKLSIPDKIVKGQEIITMSTSNPNVPGNTAALAAFNNAQADLLAANDAHAAGLGALKNLLDGRNDALVAWNNTLNNLGAFTESATQGDSTKISIAGFDVRGGPTPRPPLGAPVKVLAKTNGSPGVTKLSWDPLPGAATYLVQQSAMPITDTSWTQVGSPTKSSCETNGIEPGKEYWYRVAGVDSHGQGPWSAPPAVR